EKGNFWLGMQDRGICYSHPAARKVEVAFSTWDHGIVNTLELFQEREVWIGTEGNGVVRLNLKSMAITPVFTNDHSEKLKIYDLHKDVEGNIWVVSNTNKVHVANRQFEKIPQKLPQIQALLVDYNDRLLIGTQKGLYLHQKNDKGESVYSEVKEAKNLNILSLYEDQFKN